MEKLLLMRGLPVQDHSERAFVVWWTCLEAAALRHRICSPPPLHIGAQILETPTYSPVKAFHSRLLRAEFYSLVQCYFAVLEEKVKQQQELHSERLTVPAVGF